MKSTRFLIFIASALAVALLVPAGVSTQQIPILRLYGPTEAAINKSWKPATSRR